MEKLTYKQRKDPKLPSYKQRKETQSKRESFNLRTWWGNVTQSREERKTNPLKHKMSNGWMAHKREKARARKKDTNWFKRIIGEMKDNDVVIDNVASGRLDRYL